MSEATHGHGTTLVGATSGAVGNIVSIGIAGRSRDAIPASTMESTDKFSEFISGMADEGELAVELNYDGSDAGVANALNTAYQSGEAEVWTITFPDTSTFACSGFITNLGTADPYEDKISQSITIKLSGKATFTDVAP